MSWDELKTRARQALTQRTDAARFRLGALPRPRVAPPREDDSGRFFFDADEVQELTRLLQDRLPDDCGQVVERATRICSRRFDLLGYHDLHFGDDIDWHLDPVSGRRSPMIPWYRVPFLDHRRVGDSKVTWELNRHQHWVTLARAHLLTGEARFTDEIAAQWRAWWSGNPYPMGTNWASALEVSFRSLSWLWVKQLLQPREAMSTELTEAFVTGLAVNGRHIETYLSTYFSPNTHLLGEAVALFFIGVLEPRIAHSRRWRDRGWELILEQARRQVLPDGLHFERSAYYHVYALDFFLHARLLAGRNDVPVPQWFDEILYRQLDVLATLGSSGDVFEFGDDDGGRVFDGARNRSGHLLDPLATGASMYERADWKALAGGLREETVWLLGEDGVARFDGLRAEQSRFASRAFEESGLYSMADSEPLRRQLLIGPGKLHVPSGGHAHADLLSVQMAVDRSHVLSDSGTYVYVGADDARDRFRTTSAHSTIEISGKSQAQPGGPFSWRGFPDPVSDLWISGEGFDLFKGHHDGYSTENGTVRHTRWACDIKGKFAIVRDVVQGAGSARIDLRWNLAADVELQPAAGGTYVALVDGLPKLLLATVTAHGWTPHIETGWLSPAYGARTPRAVLRFSSEATLPADFAVLMSPIAPRLVQPSGLERLASNGSTGEGAIATRYELRHGDEAYAFCFRDGGGEWRAGDWCSDADFLCCRVDSHGRISEAIVVAGTYARFADQHLEAPDGDVESWVWKE